MNEIFMNFGEISHQISPKAADIYLHDGTVAIKYNNHVISEYIKDGKYYYLVEGKTTDLDKFIAACDIAEMCGEEDADGNTTITCGDIVAGFDAQGRLRYMDKCESIKNAIQEYIEALDEEYPNAIPIFGGALWINPTDIDRIINYLPTIISNAKFWKWHGGLADACRTFCNCLFVDPALIEACIGTKFENIVA